MLLERDEQLRALTEALDQTASEGGKVVLVRGEAGIGKSALVLEFLANEADRAHVLVGYCDDLLTPNPLGPFWDLEDDGINRSLKAGDRLGVLRATLDVLSRELRPTVVVIEDAQWADDATLDAIRYLGRRIAGSNGLLVLTFRDTEVSETHALRQVIGELDPGDVVRVRLNRLSHMSVAELIAASDSALDADEVYAMTDGNPLFATELMASAEIGLPASIRDSVLARASKLSPKARDVLNLASVIPGDSNQAMVLRLAEATVEELAECVSQGLLVVETSVVTFRHELTRHAIESALTAHDRSRLNEAVLGYLSVDGDLAQIVHHAREARNEGALVEYGPKAARAAAAIGSYQEAAANFRAVEPFLGQVAIEARAAIYSEWAEIEWEVNDDAAEIRAILSHAIELHRQVGDDLALATDLVEAAEANDDLGEPEAVDACIGEALRILESRPLGPALAAALGRQAFVALRRGQSAMTLKLSDRALSLAEELGDESAAFNALNAKGIAISVDGDALGLDLLEEARRRAALTNDAVQEVRALTNRGVAHVIRREFALAIDFLERGIAASIQANLPIRERVAAGWLAKALLFAGHWDRAGDIAVAELARPPSNVTTPTAKHVLARLAIRKGHSDAAAVLDEAWEDAGSSGHPGDFVHLAEARAELMWLTDSLDLEMAMSLRRIRDELASAPWDSEVSFWLWMAGDSSESASDVPEPFGLVMRGAPEEATKQWNQMSMPYEMAISMVLSDGEEPHQGLELLETLGAHAAASRCRQTLKRRGIAIPRGRGRKTREHPVGLTARQDEVLQLLAEDLTDGEIADRLFRLAENDQPPRLGRFGQARCGVEDRSCRAGSCPGATQLIGRVLHSGPFG